MRRVVYKQKTLTTHGNLRFILAAMTTIRSTQQLTLLLFSNLNYQSKFFFLLVQSWSNFLHHNFYDNKFASTNNKRFFDLKTCYEHGRGVSHSLIIKPKIMMMLSAQWWSFS